MMHHLIQNGVILQTKHPLNFGKTDGFMASLLVTWPLISSNRSQEELLIKGQWARHLLRKVGALQLRDLLKQISLQGILSELNEICSLEESWSSWALLCSSSFCGQNNRGRTEQTCHILQLALFVNKPRKPSSLFWCHVWFLYKFGLPSCIKFVCSLCLPSQTYQVSLADGTEALKQVGKQLNKWFNSLIILVAWEIWNRMNNCVFNGTNPNVAAVVWAVTDQACSGALLALRTSRVQWLDSILCGCLDLKKQNQL